MNIPLLKLLNRDSSYPVELILTQALPVHLIAPCALQVAWTISQVNGFDLVTLTLQGPLTIQCQRCLEPDTFPFSHTFELGICNTETILKRCLTQHDCVLKAELPATLAELITEELRLSVPEKHVEDCHLTH